MKSRPQTRLVLDFETTELVTQCLHDFSPTYIRRILILKKYFSNFSSLDCRPTWFSVSSEAPSPGEAGAGQRRRLYCGRRAVFCDAMDTQGGCTLARLESQLKLELML